MNETILWHFNYEWKEKEKENWDKKKKKLITHYSSMKPELRFVKVKEI